MNGKLYSILRCTGAAIVLIGTLYSCKKTVDPPQVVCRVTRIADHIGGDTSMSRTITYDAAGRIDTVTGAGDNAVKKTYTWSGDVLLVSTTAAGNFRSRDSIRRNGSGQVLNYRHFTAQDGSTWENTAFTYNGAGELVQTVHTNSGGGAAQVLTYTWADGNVIRRSDGIAFSYYSNERARAGDYSWQEETLQYGGRVSANRNMISAITPAVGNPISFVYTYGADGRVTRIEKRYTNGTFTSTYENSCN